MQFRRAGQEGPTRTLTAALKRVMVELWLQKNDLKSVFRSLEERCHGS